MKNFTRPVLAILVVSLSLFSCSKKSDNTPKTGALGKTFPGPVNNVLTPAILDSLKKNGVVVNDGLTPPIVNGIYLLSPTYCTFDNSGDNSAGDVYADYYYQFSAQNNTAYTIKVDYKDASDSGSDVSDTYVSGSGNLFTIFASVAGKLGNTNYKELDIISGEIQTGGIKNLQFAFYLQSKEGDTNNTEVVKVGTTRIFKDEDGNSTRQTTFSLPKKEIQDLKTAGKLLRSFEAIIVK